MAGGPDSWSQIKATYASLGVAGRIAAAAGALCIVVVGVSLYGFAQGMFGPAISASVTPADPKDPLQHDKDFEHYLAQWNGRSLLIVPGAPPPKIVEKPVEKIETKPNPGPPPSYGGPAIIAMILDTVWFDDGSKLSVGDDPKEGVEIVQVLAPWEALVKWKGGTFTVPLFQRDKIVAKPEDKADDKPGAPSQGDIKPTEETAKAPKPQADLSKSDHEQLIVTKPAPKHDDPKAEPKPDAAPGAAPATAPPADAPQGPETSQKETDSSRPSAAANGGRS